MCSSPVLSACAVNAQTSTRLVLSASPPPMSYSPSPEKSENNDAANQRLLRHLENMELVDFSPERAAVLTAQFPSPTTIIIPTYTSSPSSQSQSQTPASLLRAPSPLGPKPTHFRTTPTIKHKTGSSPLHRISPHDFDSGIPMPLAGSFSNVSSKSPKSESESESDSSLCNCGCGVSSGMNREWSAWCRSRCMVNHDYIDPCSACSPFSTTSESLLKDLHKDLNQNQDQVIHCSVCMRRHCPDCSEVYHPYKMHAQAHEQAHALEMKQTHRRASSGVEHRAQVKV